MAQLAVAALMMAGTAVSAASTIAGGNAAAQVGSMTQQAMEFRAKGNEQAAQESRAASQRTAFDKRHEATLVGSRLQAVAAASGGGATDPSVLKLGEDIAGEGEYGALLESYKGENRARGLLDQAAADRFSGEMAMFEGRSKRSASRLSAFGSILSGAGSAWGTYNKLPSAAPATDNKKLWFG
jgi:hypothetical protein